MTEHTATFDVFLSHSHPDAMWVDNLAQRLTDEHAMRVWLDRWVLIPGTSWQQEMARGLNQTMTCAVCIGARTPGGWFREEIERALDIQTRNSHFRVIPILLPDANLEAVPEFLALRTWADFRQGQDEAYALHVLVQGIKGLPVGRWAPGTAREDTQALQEYERKLKELQRLKTLGLHEEVVIEFERKILSQWLDGKRKNDL